MNPHITTDFDQRYQTHLKHLKLKCLQPKTIDAYSRTIRRMGDYFEHQIENLSPAQLTDYFSDLVSTHSWSAVKLDLYGFKFYTQHVLGKPWVMPNFIKPPKVQRLPDIVTVEEAQALFAATRTVSGVEFLRLVLQHVLPKGFRRARNYGFLHPNSKRLIALLRLLVFTPRGKAPTELAPSTQTQRPKLLCRCCCAAMPIVRRRILPVNMPPTRANREDIAST